MWYICILNCSLLQKKNDVSMNDLGFTKSFFFAESLSDTHCKWHNLTEKTYCKNKHTPM